MSSRANYFKLGLFVIAAVVLTVASIIVLGAGALFKTYIYMETYFDESVQGLSRGSAVKYRGVQVGHVKDINFCRSIYPESRGQPEYDRYVYVLMAIDPRIFDEEDISMLDQVIADRVNGGMRVRLAALGLTGAVYVEADYLGADAPSPMPCGWEPKNYYLPSASSVIVRFSESLGKILDNLDKVDFPKIGANLAELLTTLDHAVASFDAGGLRTEAVQLITELRASATRVRDLLEQPSVAAISGDTAAAAAGLRRFVDLLASNSTEKVISELPGVVTQLRSILNRMNVLFANQHADIESIVTNLRVFSENLRALGEFVQKYPTQLLFGEPPPPATNGGP
ncbi:MAG: MlaD family protein [Planctomycetota bacterium]